MSLISQKASARYLQPFLQPFVCRFAMAHENLTGRVSEVPNPRMGLLEILQKKIICQSITIGFCSAVNKIGTTFNLMSGLCAKKELFKKKYRKAAFVNKLVRLSKS